MTEDHRWPDGFMWGTGASSTQCEGAAPASDWLAWERAGKAPGDLGVGDALRSNAVELGGPARLVRSFPKWFGLHPFAAVEHPPSRPRVSA